MSLDEKQPLRSYYFSSAWEGKQKDANDKAPITVEMNQELETSNNFKTCNVVRPLLFFYFNLRNKLIHNVIKTQAFI